MIKKLILFFLICFSATLYAQDKKTTTPSNIPNSSINTDGIDILKNLQIQNPYNQNFKLVSLEGAINSDSYVVGPNDQFDVGLYGYINQQLPLIVSPEGYLIIPTVGQIKASGLTITELRNTVTKAVKKRYYSSDVSLALTVPRSFLVTVTGLKQGTYEASPVMRVSTLINYVLVWDSANIIQNYQKNTDNRVEKFYDTYPSLRNIELRKKSGQVQTVDIYKYFMTKDDKYNPYLSEGDNVKVPNVLLSRNYITVNGAIQLSGNYEYNESDDLETVIGLGRGFAPDAELDSIELFRPYGENKGYDIINLSYEKDKAYKINVYDRIFVKFKTNFQKNITVLVLGEVLRPGYYPISFKSTRLKEIIDMAGGFRQSAYLPLCILFRKYDEEYAKKDTNEILINLRANDVVVTEKDRRNFEEDVRSKRNRVIVDFEKLYKANDESQNIILEDKDIIYINDNKNVVYVYGQVNNEGYVQFKEGEDVEYYIEKAGGYGLGADDGKTRIIKFNSRGWYKTGDTKINSGDFVYVPKVEKKTFSDIITIISQISGVILGVLTTYILIKSNTK